MYNVNTYILEANGYCATTGYGMIYASSYRNAIYANLVILVYNITCKHNTQSGPINKIVSVMLLNVDLHSYLLDKSRVVLQYCTLQIYY